MAGSPPGAIGRSSPIHDRSSKPSNLESRLIKVLADSAKSLAIAVKTLPEANKTLVMLPNMADLPKVLEQVMKARGLSPAQCKMAAEDLLKDAPDTETFEFKVAEYLSAKSDHVVAAPAEPLPSEEMPVKMPLSRGNALRTYERETIQLKDVEDELSEINQWLCPGEISEKISPLIEKISTTKHVDPEIQTELTRKIALILSDPDFLISEIFDSTKDILKVLQNAGLGNFETFVHALNTLCNETLPMAERRASVEAMDLSPEAKEQFKKVVACIVEGSVWSLIENQHNMLDGLEWIKLLDHFEIENSGLKQSYDDWETKLSNPNFSKEDLLGLIGQRRSLRGAERRQFMIDVVANVIRFFQAKQEESPQSKVKWTVAMLNFCDVSHKYIFDKVGSDSPIPRIRNVKLFDDFGERQRLSLDDIGIMGEIGSEGKKVKLQPKAYYELRTLIWEREKAGGWSHIPYVELDNGQIMIFINRHIDEGAGAVKDERGHGTYKRVRDAVVVDAEGNMNAVAVGKSKIKTYNDLKSTYFEETMLASVPESPHVLKSIKTAHYKGVKKNIMTISPMAKKTSIASVADVVSRFSGAAQGLAHLHKHGVVHNDFKVSNTVVDVESDHVRVIDFGLSVNYELGLGHDEAVHGGTYMPPESVYHRYESSRRALIDIPFAEMEKVDTWAFGVSAVRYLGKCGALSPAVMDVSEHAEKMRRLTSKFSGVWEPGYAYLTNKVSHNPDPMKGEIRPDEMRQSIQDFAAESMHLVHGMLCQDTNTPQEHALGRVIIKCLRSRDERPRMQDVAIRMEDIRAMGSEIDAMPLPYAEGWAFEELPSIRVPSVASSSSPSSAGSSHEVWSSSSSSIGTREINFYGFDGFDVGLNIKGNKLSDDSYQSLLDLLRRDNFNTTMIIFIFECASAHDSFIKDNPQQFNELTRVLLDTLSRHIVTVDTLTLEEDRQALLAKMHQHPFYGDMMKRINGVIDARRADF